MRVESLVVTLRPSYVFTTPVIPGVPLPSVPPTYALTTPVVPGVAGDDLDETYLPTTRSGPTYAGGAFDVDETYLPTTFSVSYGGTDVSAVTFPPVRRKSTVQTLTTVLIPGADQTVIFEAVRDV